jgi:PAS domain S-box-containing protein
MGGDLPRRTLPGWSGWAAVVTAVAGFAAWGLACGLALGDLARVGAGAEQTRRTASLLDGVAGVGAAGSEATAARVAALRASLTALGAVEGRPERDQVARLDAVLARLERLQPGDPAAAELLDQARARGRELDGLLRGRAAAELARLRTTLLRGAAAGVFALLAAAVAGALLFRGRRSDRAADHEAALTQLLVAAIRSTEEGVLITDTGGRGREPVIVFTNPALCAMAGMTAAELVGQPLRVLRSKCLREHEFSLLEHSYSNSKSANVETVRWREDGSKVYCEWHISPVRGAGGRVTHFVSVLRDTTRLREQEEAERRSHEELVAAHRQLQENQRQLVQSEKMAFLGQLAAGVAHEINNPVGYVMSNLETLSDDLQAVVPALRQAEALLAGDEAPDEVLPALRETLGRAEVESFLGDVDDILQESAAGLVQVKEIVQELKNFARPDDGVLEDADVNREVEAAIRIAWNELKHRVKVITHCGELPPLRCRPGQLNQVFTNLLVNAAQAVHERGEITIETRVEGREIVISVADTGEGIAPENLERVFTPFFTTKPAGKGTGLGLAVSYGIVQKHRGTIGVESEVGRGTTFTVRLPLDGADRPEG